MAGAPFLSLSDSGMQCTTPPPPSSSTFPPVVFSCQISYGVITLATCQNIRPVMTGTIVAVVMAFLILTLWTLLFPDRTGSYEKFKGIEVRREAEWMALVGQP